MTKCIMPRVPHQPRSGAWRKPFSIRNHRSATTITTGGKRHRAPHHIPPPRIQPQPPAGDPPLVCDPNPRETVPDSEWAEENQEPPSVSHTKDDHRKGGANADRSDQDGQESICRRVSEP